MQVTRSLKYFDYYLPPRCRKLRSQEKTAQFSVEVPEVTGEIAPVAIVQHDRWMPRRAEHGDTSTKTIEYRWYNHRLYVRPRLRRFMCLREGQRNRWATINDVHQHDAYRTHDSREAAEASLHRRYEDFVLIDGHLYEEIGEPRYVINTFGLGCNHGLGWGTSMGVDNYYNSNISKERYFRIDQEEECRQEGRRIAERRGDTKAFPHFDKRLYERCGSILRTSMAAATRSSTESTPLRKSATRWSPAWERWHWLRP